MRQDYYFAIHWCAQRIISTRFDKFHKLWCFSCDSFTHTWKSFVYSSKNKKYKVCGVLCMLAICMVSRAFYDLSDCFLSSGGYKINLIIIVLPGIRWQANNNNNNNNHIVVFVCIEVCLSAVQILEGFPLKIYIYISVFWWTSYCPTLL